jgi:regulator of nonsense transcripts 2
MDAFIAALPNCVNRELIDKAAKDFCMNLNTKYNRKRLVSALFQVQRTRLDLLPFYSRLVAILNPCMPEIANDLAFLLKNDFRFHIKKKDQINIESKIKNVRFIGELVKFKMFNKIDALNCLKSLLGDLKHHNIEMTCNLLETCGRYLYRNLETHQRLKLYLEILMRKKQISAMDNRYTIMIENAFYYCNPPENKQIEKKIRIPIHEYIKKQLYKDLNKINVEKILRQLRKINWKDDDLFGYTVKSLIAAWNVRYNSIHCLANLVSGLASYYVSFLFFFLIKKILVRVPSYDLKEKKKNFFLIFTKYFKEEIGIQVVDGVIEDIRLGLEVNLPKFNQRRISMVKYLGELYNYRMVESAIIFKTVYTIITYAVTLDCELKFHLKKQRKIKYIFFLNSKYTKRIRPTR